MSISVHFMLRNSACFACGLMLVIEATQDL